MQNIKKEITSFDFRNCMLCCALAQVDTPTLTLSLSRSLNEGKSRRPPTDPPYHAKSQNSQLEEQKMNQNDDIVNIIFITISPRGEVNGY